MLVASILMRSAGIALLAAIFIWLAVSFVTSWTTEDIRRKVLLILLMLGISVQAAWMFWASKNQILDWPPGGLRGESYISQLKLRSGNHPELGQAAIGELPVRVFRNLGQQMAALPNLLTGFSYWLNPSWFSPAVWIPLSLILLGVGSSIWLYGGDLTVWYFVSYWGMYALWPWELEVRFLLPVAPLFCLYLWRGAEALRSLISERPTTVARGCLVFSAPLVLYSVAWAGVYGGGQALLSALFWTVLATVATYVIGRAPKREITAFTSFARRLQRTLATWQKPSAIMQIASVVLLTVLVGVETAGQVRIGLENLHFDIAQASNYPEIEASNWIRLHASSNDVVMARALPVVYHYSRLKVIWFPPISDPQILMDGINKHHIRWVVLTGGTYWQPTDKECFELLRRSYPGAFHLVHNGPHDSLIFQVQSST
jgi:hypothetical protein